MIMGKRVELTIAAANALLKAVKWRRHAVEYQVMIRRVTTHPDTGKEGLSYQYAYAVSRGTCGQAQRIWPQSTYRDALVEAKRVHPSQLDRVVIFRVTTERPA